MIEKEFEKSLIITLAILVLLSFSHSKVQAADTKHRSVAPIIQLLMDSSRLELCTIDYLTTSGIGSLPVSSSGQTWTTPCTGYLSSITVNDQCGTARGLFKLQIFQGESILSTDKIGECNNITITGGSIAGGINRIDIPFILLVKSGLKYTFLLSCDSGDCHDKSGYGLWLRYSSDPYPEGKWCNSSGCYEGQDLAFKIVISNSP